MRRKREVRDVPFGVEAGHGALSEFIKSKSPLPDCFSKVPLKYSIELIYGGEVH